MGMQKHTAGPWRAGSRNVLAVDREGYLVAVAEVFAGAAATIGEADANQRLIVAAPELLDLLLESVGVILGAAHVTRGSPADAFIERALKLVERIEGEQ